MGMECQEMQKGVEHAGHGASLIGKQHRRHGQKRFSRTAFSLSFLLCTARLCSEFCGYVSNRRNQSSSPTILRSNPWSDSSPVVLIYVPRRSKHHVAAVQTLTSEWLLQIARYSAVGVFSLQPSKTSVKKVVGQTRRRLYSSQSSTALWSRRYSPIP